MNRIKINSGTSWETEYAYSRAVRVGNTIEVSGTTSMDGEQLVGSGDAYRQACFCFEKIQRALREAGADIKDTVRTRMYLVSSMDIDAVLKAHAKFFKDISPAATLVLISGLIKPELLVEIELTAIVS